MITRRETSRRGPFRDEFYRAFLREEGLCVACVSETHLQNQSWPAGEVMRRVRAMNKPCDPAHGPPNGRSSKGPDSEAIPLCRAHHDEQHLMGSIPAFEEKYQFNWMFEAGTWYAAYLIWKERTGANPD